MKRVAIAAATLALTLGGLFAVDIAQHDRPVRVPLACDDADGTLSTDYGDGTGGGLDHPNGQRTTTDNPEAWSLEDLQEARDALRETLPPCPPTEDSFTV